MLFFDNKGGFMTKRDKKQLALFRKYLRNKGLLKKKGG
jgi:hypothetical protein